MIVKINDAKHTTYRHKDQIKALGFKFVKEGHSSYWIKDIDSEEELLKIEMFCDKNKLAFLSPFTVRNGKYRKEFLEHYEPPYHCSYCGKTLNNDTLVVDHLIPVHLAQTSLKYRNKLRKSGCESVNDYKNLTASCGYCNSSKGKKTGFWILRGKLGKSKTFWNIFRIINIILIFLVFCLVFYYLNDIFSFV